MHITVSSQCTPDLVYVPDDNDIVVKEIFSGSEINTLRGHYAQVRILNDTMECKTNSTESKNFQ